MSRTAVDDAIAAAMSLVMAIVVVWLLALAMRYLDQRLGDTDRQDNVLTEVPFVRGQVRVDLWIARRFRPLIVPLVVLFCVLAAVRRFL